VARKLRGLWSPEQIAGWLKYAYPDDENFQVSHETIYKSLFIQARGALKKELLQHLRRTRMMRRGRSHTQKTATHGRITARSRSGNGQLQSRTVLYQVTGKVI
jgi:IS30 family transposase